MNTLLVYPAYRDTFWSFRHALTFITAKAAFPPLGLLTVAAMLPAEWIKRLVDMNVEPLSEEHADWADIVFLSAMAVQSRSFDEAVRFFRERGVRVVAGGPHVSHRHAHIRAVDHMVAGEAEEVLPRVIEDLAQNRARPLYPAERFPDLARTPVPLWDLLDLDNYTSMGVQLSRGCPFECDFCDVVTLFGRRPRYKEIPQLMTELDDLYHAGWRGNVMFVDDNFIGNRKKAKDLLLTLVQWQADKGYPFFFVTQASINLADDAELLSLMAQADFKQVFVGIETPSQKSLSECNKKQNLNRDIVSAVKTIQSYGLEVMGGFIVGFDADPPSIFEDQVRLIEEAAIPNAMVGLLSVMEGTRLWDRMRKEGRLLGFPTGDNIMSLEALNFEPKMGRETLITGYQNVLERLYESRAFYGRVLRFFKIHRPNSNAPRRRPTGREVAAFFRILWGLGFKDPNRLEFWRFLTAVIVRRYDFAMAVNFAAYGYHFRVINRRFLESRKEENEDVRGYTE
jgi:radical SAM superfamily enzyme YgiQ (UPF0313 family)